MFRTVLGFLLTHLACLYPPTYTTPHTPPNHLPTHQHPPKIYTFEFEKRARARARAGEYARTIKQASTNTRTYMPTNTRACERYQQLGALLKPNPFATQPRPTKLTMQLPDSPLQKYISSAIKKRARAASWAKMVRRPLQLVLKQGRHDSYWLQSDVAPTQIAYQ